MYLIWSKIFNFLFLIHFVMLKDSLFLYLSPSLPVQRISWIEVKWAIDSICRINIYQELCRQENLGNMNLESIWNKERNESNESTWWTDVVQSNSFRMEGGDNTPPLPPICTSQLKIDVWTFPIYFKFNQWLKKSPPPQRALHIVRVLIRHVFH